MRKIALAIGLICAAGQIHAGFWDTIKSVIPKHVHVKPLGVRVLLLHDEEGATIGVNGKYKLYDPNTKELISTRFVGKCKPMEAFGAGLRWHEEFPGLHQLLIVSDDSDGYLTVNGVEYKGELYVYDVGGKISVVNELPLEDFLHGLLAGMYHDQMSDEMLSAIAIAARTDTLFKIENPRNKFWAIDGRQIGFKGQENVNPSSPIAHAIEETHGMVLTVGEEELRYFPAQWDSKVGADTNKHPQVLSKITVEDAQDLAKEGQDATAILSRAFPGSRLCITQ